jgi:hypothetical protein
LLEIKTWGIEWKKAIDKTHGWATWQWVNVKIDKERLALFKQTINISKENMEDYDWMMLTHAMDFFKKCSSLKKLILKHFLTTLVNDLLTKDLVTLGNLLST